jgi:HD-GYP domain-containing protein (c-di-GMP phosphodiesterase class II)
MSASLLAEYGEPDGPRRVPASGGLPISDASLSLAELAATFALAQDNSFGQPLESQLRSCALATWIAPRAGVDADGLDTVYWTALLRYLGCTAHAHEVSLLFGDEIAARAQTLVHDAANPHEVLGDAVAFLTAGLGPEESAEIAGQLQAGMADWARANFGAGCEAGDMLARRLGMPEEVRAALAHTFERWNGAGWPNGARGDEIPLAMRVVHLAHDMEAISRRRSHADAIATATDRRGRTYDPDVVDAFLVEAPGLLERLDALEPWDAVLALAPASNRPLSGAELDEALTVAADFIDLKSPTMGGHSRRCADLAADAAGVLGLDAEERVRLRRAALVHEFGTSVVPNSIWDKPGPLTRAERDRVGLHPLVTEQMLRRSPALSDLIPVAAAHHEKADGSGYHRSLVAAACTMPALVLAAVDVYVGLTSARAHRPPFEPESAATEVRRLIDAGELERRSAAAVLEAAGHGAASRPRGRRRDQAGGLTDREVEVLRLAASGLTTQQIADRLVISPKTVDHHIQHVYTKIGVSSRAAAALWAIQNGVVG